MKRWRAACQWRGHLYNWYDLNTLEVLDPPYVSSVDSGNYVAFLMAAAQLLRQHLSELDAADRELRPHGCPG